MSYPLGNGGVGAQASWGSGFARNAAEAMYPELWYGLVAAWFPSLGATGLTLHDITGNGHDGALTAMDPATDWIMGPNGPILTFDGSDDDIDIGLQSFSTSAFSIAARARSRDTGHSFQYIIGRNAGGNNAGDFGLVYNGDFNYHLFVQDGVNTRNAGSNATQDTLWHSYAATLDASALKYYHDGVFADSDTGTTLPAHGSLSMAIANQSPGEAGDANFEGELEFVAIWNRTLTASEIKLLHFRPDALIARPNDLSMQIAAMRGFVAPAGGIVVLRRRRECA